MASINVDTTALEEALARLSETLDRRMSEAAEDVAVTIADYAKDHHDYIDRTGFLTASIAPGKVTGTFSKGTLSVNVQAGGKGVTYARYIEEGTARIRPRRFLAGAIEATEDEQAERFGAALEAALKESGF